MTKTFYTGTRAVIYTGTRNLYEHMVPAMRSLLKHSHVDRIYLMIEDDAFPYPLPDQARILNVRDQTVFPPEGPNYTTRFRPICMMRAACARVLPSSLKRVLQLDVDTIIDDSIDELWDMDLTGKWFAAVPEHLGTFKPYGPRYFNAGVMMLNLAEIRRDRITGELVRMLNTEQVPYIDQDAWNKAAAEHPEKAAELPVRFNECFVTGYTDRPAIVHYAGCTDWTTSSSMFRVQYRDKYRAMLDPWEAIHP